MTRLAGRLIASCLIVGVASCGHGGPTDPDRTVAWRLDIGAEGDFAVRIWLNGEAVYSQSTPAARWHVVDVERPYRRGEHVVEFEILAASSSPATYAPSWTIRVRPGNTSATADGAPTILSVGERLTIRVSL